MHITLLLVVGFVPLIHSYAAGSGEGSADGSGLGSGSSGSGSGAGNYNMMHRALPSKSLSKWPKQICLSGWGYHGSRVYVSL